MAECNHDCASCQSKCSEATSLLAPQNAGSNVKHVIGVVSGKGGVGKSLVTGLMATLLKRRGYATAVLDADITGPSIPRMFGVHEKAMGCDEGILPAESKTGVKLMSINLLLEHDADPVVWRGALIAGTVKQFWTDVLWGDVDFMFVDMPPGTGDVPLTVFQSLPVDGIIIVASPQARGGRMGEKGANVAREDDEHFRAGRCGKQELDRLPGLRQEDLSLWRGQNPASGAGPQPAAAGPAAHPARAGLRLRQGPGGAVQ